MTAPYITPSKICNDCGNPYNLFCVPCRSRLKMEMVEDLLDKVGLNEAAVIEKLAEHVFTNLPGAPLGSLAALKEVIVLKQMRPATKVEATGPNGGPINLEVNEARHRIAALANRIASRDGEE